MLFFFYFFIRFGCELFWFVLELCLRGREVFRVFMIIVVFFISIWKVVVEEISMYISGSVFLEKILFRKRVRIKIIVFRV